MARPSKVADLADHEARSHEFIRIDPQFLTRDVRVGAALLNLIEAARQSDGFELDEDGTFTVSVPLTDEELAQRVKNAQRSWDFAQESYSKALSDEPLASYYRHTVDAWAEREGNTPIDWEQYDARQVVTA